MGKLFLALPLWFVWTNLAFSQDAKPLPRTDALGDPLPEGALSRIGSSRLRNPSCILLLAFSPSGKRLLSAGLQGDVRIWESPSGKLVKQFDLGLNYPPEHITDLAFRDDDLLRIGTARTGRVAAVETWNLKTGRKTGHRQLDKSEGFDPLLFSRDAKLFVAHESGIVRTFEIAGDRPIASIAIGFTNPYIVLDAAASRFAVSEFGGTGTVRVFEARTGKLLNELRHPTRRIGWVALSPDGKKLVSSSIKEDEASRASTVTIWDLKSGKSNILFHDEYTVDNQFSADGLLLATSAAKRGLSVWNLADGKERRLDSRTYALLTFSPDGKLLAARGADGEGITLFDVAIGKKLSMSANPLQDIKYLRYGNDGKQLLGFSKDFIRWDTATGKEMARFAGYADFPWRVALSPDETRVAVHGFKSLRLLDARTGKETVKLQNSNRSSYDPVFSPDGKVLAAGGEKMILVWDATTGKQLHRLKGYDSYVVNVRFSADGRTLAGACNHSSSDNDFMIRLWDLIKGQEIRRFDPGQQSACHIAFSPDGKHLAAACRDESAARSMGSIRMWEVTTGKEVLSTSELARCRRVAFSSDSRMLAMGTNKGAVKILEVATGKERLVLRGHQGEIHDLIFTPDKKKLATSSPDGPVLIWDVGGSLEPRVKLSQEDLDKAWQTLSGDDAQAAFVAIRRLARIPAQALPVFKQRLRPVAKPDVALVEKWIAALGSELLAERKQAEAELAKLADAGASILLAAAAKADSLEQKRRLELILDRLESSAATRLAVRAVETLEWMDHPDAAKLIGELATGAPDARLTREAQQALARIGKK